jgi:hypothetical protein
MVKYVECEDCEPLKDEEGKCIFANETRVIDGEEYVFCCATCADSFVKKHQG